MNWRDPIGLIHLHPEPGIEQTENAPLFTGTNIVFTREARKPQQILLAKGKMFFKSLEHLYVDGVWRTTPNNDVGTRFSNDNFKGVICALEVLKPFFPKEYKLWKSRIPLFHKQLIRPDNFILVGYFKYPLLFTPLLPIAFGAMLVSSYRNFKFDDDGNIVQKRTSGKCLVYVILKAFRFKRMFTLCQKVMKKYSIFPTWREVFSYYYERQDHPNVLLIKEIGE